MKPGDIEKPRIVPKSNEPIAIDTYGQKWPGEMFSVLSLAVCQFCSEYIRVLEATSLSAALTSPLNLEPDLWRVCYVSGNKNLETSLQTQLGSKDIRVLQSADEITTESVFDAVVYVAEAAASFSTVESVGSTVRQVLPFLTNSGILLLISERRAALDSTEAGILQELAKDGFHTVAFIDVAPGAFPQLRSEGAAVVLKRQAEFRKLVGTLRDEQTAEALPKAFAKGPSKESGLNWDWLASDDAKTFTDIEYARSIDRLKPKGSHKPTFLASLLVCGSFSKADTPVRDEEQGAVFLFVPEYSSSQVTTNIEEQTVAGNAVYRLPLHPAKCNPRFLARLLNSPYGKKLRARTATGVTVRRVSEKDLLGLVLPVPDLALQDQIARVDGDIGLVQAALLDIQSKLDEDWAGVSAIVNTIRPLSAALDIDHQIADWGEELPYPLATIYRRYQATDAPKQQVDDLLQFFEMAAIYLAVMGLSNINLVRKDSQDVISKWLHPTGCAGIERPDFGFWIRVAKESLKEARRLASDKGLSASVIKIPEPELVKSVTLIGSLGKALGVLEIAKDYRNSRAHGGYAKESDARRLLSELRQCVRNLYEITSPVLREFQLVRPGTVEVTDSVFKYKIEKLSGSDPIFRTETTEQGRIVKSGSLAFWISGERFMCPVLPFFRLGTPSEPADRSFYVFSRLQKDNSCRFVSFQEAREQEFCDQDQELFALIAFKTENW